ncbi:hypothetical protein BCR34DRAFT_626004 [Clohesyomyces aquaticus]|uniref:Heterokaryon incompatibility domain-containing protein n=1 Tax=Clohesyomyces aquaticus TaxID=1231657 RepID=A0A1Y1ZF60_9PLEO|nr:hypothetical protein BCR34DRAFT_626004 [Clohesyomyces aquaticus]
MFNRSRHGIVEPNISNITSDFPGPRRLIDVRVLCDECDVDCGHEVCLAEDLTVTPKYVTLSHCCGRRLEGNAMKTTGSLHIRKSGVRLEDLPANFRDAIGITRRIDSPEDWVIESVNMGYIYDQSYLTIAASSNRDSSGGCYRSSGMSTQAELGGGTSIDIRNNLADGRPTTLVLWAPTLSDAAPLREPTPLLGCPLSQRGWMFHKRILSPRKIHFTSFQLVWDCRELYEAEDRLPFITTQETLSLSMTRKISADIIKEIWYDWLVGFGYSKRIFTKMDDRLIVIAGSARSLHERTGTHYLAGTSFVASKRRHQSANVFHLRRRPTWTWASTDHEFEYPTRELEQDQDFCYLSSKIQTAGDIDDPFGLVVGGVLEIRGKI